MVLIWVEIAAALMAVVYTSYESGGLAISTSALHSGDSCAARSPFRVWVPAHCMQARKDTRSHEQAFPDIEQFRALYVTAQARLAPRSLRQTPAQRLLQRANAVA